MDTTNRTQTANGSRRHYSLAALGTSTDTRRADLRAFASGQFDLESLGFRLSSKLARRLAAELQQGRSADELADQQGWA